MRSITRKHVLDEIKRTASENSGVPLGRERFEKETGIKGYYWGKYWARWSDAQREADFSPNEMQSAYSDEFLIEKYIECMRELRRFPTFADLRVRSHNDTNFPNAKTFQRFGKKHEIAVKINGYCQGREGYGDIASICDVALEKNQEQVDSEHSEVMEFGFVYLLKSGRYYKIGKTNAVGRRERELAIQMPEKAATIHSIKTDDPAGIEVYWHKRFESKRKGGEWFDLSAEEVRAFKRRKFM